MTISVTSWTTTSTDHVHARDSRAEIEHVGGSDDFAGMLAGAVQSSAPKPEPKQAKEEGTSELDKPEEPAEENDDRKKVKRSRPRVENTAATNADTNEVVQATSALDPELQAKLARVIERMRAETGHEVKVSETYRTQERQDALFAQGRETDGPVVTWTRNSKHTQGRAVDVTLEGAGMDAYAILQRIAKEEGLRTLGARDPGHLELQSSGRSLSANDVTLAPAEPADATGRGQVSVARLAQVAQVAQVTVEKPAEVARVASVARPEIPGVTSRTQPVQAVTSGESAQIMIDDARNARRSGADSGDANSNSSGNGKNEQRGGFSGYSALAAAVAHRDAAPSLAPTSIVGASETILSGAERAAQIIAAYQDAPARPLSQITMSVDAGNGITDKVQIALRGTSLNAAIDTGDMRGAEAMRARADELVRALTRDGIDVEALRVRAAAGAVSVTTSQQSSDTGQSKFERNQQWQQQHERQRSQDDHRRQQQRDQRGGRDE